MTLSLVGDPAQSLYLFRNSNADLLLKMNKIIPSAKEYTILKNYRTPKQLVDIANLFRKCFEEHGIAYTPSVPHMQEMPDILAIRHFDDSVQEINSLARDIRALKDKGVPYSKISVLCRTNKMLTDMESGFISYKIPYFLKYDSWSVMKQSPFRFIYSLYSLILNPQDIYSFCEMLLPIKGIGEKFVEKVKFAYSSHMFSRSTRIVDFFNEENITEDTKQWQIVFRFVKDFIQPAVKRQDDGIAFSTFNQTIFSAMDGLFNYEALQNPVKGKLELGIERGQFLKVFKTLETVYGIAREDHNFSKKTYQEQFFEIYENLQLSQDVYAKENKAEDIAPEKDAVGLHTIHSYKGKENDYIYYACVNPLSNMDYFDFSEKCAFYVGITRAKRKLILSGSDAALNYENRMVRTYENPFLAKILQIVKDYKGKQENA